MFKSNVSSIAYNQKLLKSVILLFLAVSSNFVGNTLGCKTQYHMTNNMYVKHIVLFIIIYFTLNFTSNDKENPLEMLKNAIIIWICFVLFTKTNLTFKMISALLFIGTYILDNFIDYYNKLIEESKSKKEKLKLIETHEKLIKIRYWTFRGGLGSLVVGFFVYFKEKKDEYSDRFDMIDFILGKPTCKSLNDIIDINQEQE